VQCFNLHGLIFLSIPVQNILNHNILVFMALAVWLITNWSGAHGHMCFDGQEPSLTVHMELMSDHPEHDASEKHVDANVDLSQLLIIKFIKIDLPFLITTLLLFLVLLENSSVLIAFYSRVFSSHVTGLRPPLRAPPALPA
jgi:hypothetical protein